MRLKSGISGAGSDAEILFRRESENVSLFAMRCNVQLSDHLETQKHGKMAALRAAAWMSDKCYEDIYVRLSLPVVK